MSTRNDGTTPQEGAMSILNPTRMSLSGPSYLHEMVSPQPTDHIAIDHLSADGQRRRLSYTLMRQYARALALELQSHVAFPAGQESIVPVIIPQCPELYISYLAILQAGAGFCPISPDTPIERLKFVIGDVSAKVALTVPAFQSRLQQALPDVMFLTVSLASLESRWCADQDECVSTASYNTCRPEQIAYVMYTSGSTGLPKGVKVSHHAVTQSLLAHHEHIPVFKRFLQFASPTFDVSVFEIFFPFFRAATLVCCEREHMLADLPGTIRRLHVDAAELTPTVAGTLLRTRAAAPCLTTLLTIGEMLTRHVVDEFGGSETRESMLYAMYGPTEAAIHCTLAPRLSTVSSVRSIGVPLSTVTAFVLDAQDESAHPKILPIDQEGELAIAGQLATGYLNRPEQTSKSFVCLPGHGEVYRTGDRAVVTKEGMLQILGRISSGQVKLRGQRVELGEIEEVAGKTGGVSLAIASIIDDAVILFCDGSPEVQAEHISETCKMWLPQFMRPSDIVLLEHGVPRLPSGKVDKIGLEQSYQRRSRRRTRTSASALVSPMEKQIIEIIQNELCTEIDPRVNLGPQGLDSLRAIQVAAVLRPTFPSISAFSLLEADSVSDLLRKIAESDEYEHKYVDAQIFEHSSEWHILQSELLRNFEPRDVKARPESIAPCSFMQIAMLAETASSPDTNFNSILLKKSPDVSLRDVTSAFMQVAARNGILRSGFVPTNNPQMPFVQLVWPDLVVNDEPSLERPVCINRSVISGEISITIHHALYDGWSWDLILHDVNRILSNESPPHRPPFDDFRRFTAKRRYVHCDRDSKFWWKALQGFKSTLLPNLSTKRKKGVSQSSVGCVLDIDTGRYSKRCQQLSVSKQAVLQSALALLLGTYCDTDDVAFGIVSSGREVAVRGIEQIIGPCLATIPLRIDLTSVATTQDLLKYVQRQQAEGIKHSSIDLVRIRRAAGIQPTDRMFDTLCVWQDGLKPPEDLQNKIVTTKTTDKLEYSLVLEATSVGPTIHLKLTFDENRLPSAQACLVLQQLNASIATLLSEEVLQLHTVWNHLSSSLSSVSNPDFQTFDLAFDFSTSVRQAASMYPDRAAIEFVTEFDLHSGQLSREITTYREMYSISSRRARRIIQRYNIQPDDLVCILLEKSTDLYLTIFSVVLSGAGYMCVDPKTPNARVEKILVQSNCALIITSDVERCRAHSPATQVIATVEEIDVAETKLKVDLPTSVPADCLAYTVFTSGSTGIPKGVLITRKNLLSNLNCLTKIYPQNAETDKMLQSCSQAFDVSVFEIFWTWHVGMTLCSAQNDVLFRDIEKFIDATSITHLSMTPSVAALIQPVAVPKVKFLVTAGEPMNSKVFDTWRDRGLFQGYGPSETTNICNVRPSVVHEDQINNVGPVFENTSIFVCRPQSNVGMGQPNQTESDSQSSQFSLLPRGAIGEIWLGGDQVGRGYTDEVLTCKSWMEHPQYGMLYRSGDIGRLLADNSLVVLGRQDDQVKLRGLRIELGEINTALIRNNNVTDATTLVIEKASNTRLISFVVISAANKDDANHPQVGPIFEYLSANVPQYMIPDHIIPVQEIPLTRQAKIDRQRLLDIYANLDPELAQVFAKGYQDRAAKETLSGAELHVARILSEICQVPLSIVTPHSSFYGLGVDSISAVQLSRELRNAQIGEVDVSTILQFPTISQLLPKIRHQASAGTPDEISACKDYFDTVWQETIHSRCKNHGLSVQKILPCTPLQIAMLSSSIDTTSNDYKNSLSFHVHVSMESLRKAWTNVARRHPLFRTVFVETQDIDAPFAQVVLEEVSIPWLSSQAPDVSRDLLNNIAMPPYRFIPSTSDQGEDTLTLIIHHALYDAETMSLLLLEVQNFLQDSPLQDPVPFEGYIQYMAKVNKKEADAFWAGKLAEISPTRLMDVVDQFPGLNEGGGLVTSGHVTRRSRFPLSILESFAAKISTTLLPILQAALIRLLSCYTESRDICLGTIFGGRNLPIDRADEIIGPCFNTLPVRSKLQHKQATRNFIEQLQQQNLALLPFQSSSLRHMQRRMSPDGKMLFDMLLLLQQKPVSLSASIWHLKEESGTMGFPFILEAQPDRSSNNLQLTLHFQRAQAGFADTLLTGLDQLIGNSIHYPEALVDDFDFMHDFIPELSHRQDTVQLEFSPPPEPRSKFDAWTSTQQEVRDVLTILSSTSYDDAQPSTTIFRYGLDSISAVQIAATLRSKGYAISAADILEHPSIRDIANKCENNRLHAASDLKDFDLEAFDTQYRSQVIREAGIEEEKVEAVLPCTGTQSGILVQSLRSNGSLYINRLKYRLEEGAQLHALKRAWSELTRSHQMLRAGFVQLDDVMHPFAMVIYEPDALMIPVEVKPQHPNGSELSLAITNAQPIWRALILREESIAYMQIDIHHALYDAQSLRKMLRDLEALYRSEPQPEDAEIRPIVSRILGLSQETNQAKTFWASLREDLVPTRFPCLTIFNEHKHHLQYRVRDSELSMAQIAQASSELDASLLTLCQIAWARLLSAYTDQQHVTFGIILSGRMFDDDALNTAAFPCINTVPFAIDTSLEHVELRRKVAHRTSSLIKYQHISLSKIKKFNAIDENLFNTVLVVQSDNTRSNYDSAWKLVEDTASAEYAVSIEIVPQSNGALSLALTFSTSVMPAAQAEILLKQFDALLQAETNLVVAYNADDLYSNEPPKVNEIPTSVDYLHQFVEKTALITPHKTAVEFVTAIVEDKVSKKTWTYHELDLQGNKIASLLISRGSKPGDLIAVCFDKCPEASFAILGILKAGCGYVAIDPDAPAKRKRFILEDARCKFALTSGDKKTLLDGDITTVIAVDEEKSFDDIQVSRPQVQGPMNGNNTCYCLYTSGTTGTPKGCLISHASAVQAMLSFSRIFAGRWNDESRWLQFASFHFDVSVLEQYWTWKEGFCMISAPRDILFEDLPGTIRKLGITHLDLTPSLARLLTPQEVPQLCEGVFIVGGEQVKQDILDMWGGTGCLYNFYGPSEVTIGCTVHKCVPKNARPTNIGNQWDNVGSFVLKQNTHELVLRGAVGELCLSGPLVGKGYLNRPDLTAEKFVSLEGQNTRIYRTGDLVRLLHDGSFDFLGRIDGQVKLRGQRLEVGEINHIILQESAKVRDASTLVLKHPTQEKEQLVAFFSTSKSIRDATPPRLTSDSQSRVLAESIRKSCSDHLPLYMIPTHIIAIDHMPLSVNNKIDNKSLQAIFESMNLTHLHDPARGDHDQHQAQSSLIIKLTETLASYLCVDQSHIQYDSSLFALGLDSISVIGLSRVMKKCGFSNIDIAKIMSCNYVSDLVRVIESQQEDHELKDAIESAKVKMLAFKADTIDEIRTFLENDRETLEEILPSTPLQEGMISRMTRSDAEEAPYLGRFLYRLHQSTDILRMQKAWSKVANVLDILRTRFVATTSGYAQVVLAQSPPQNICVHQAEPGNGTDNLFADWKLRAKLLGETSPWEVHLVHHADGSKIMQVFLFHAIYDGISLSVLLRTVLEAYRHEGAISKPALQFKDTLAYGPLLERVSAINFWKQSLTSIDLLELQPDLSTPRSLLLRRSIKLPGINRICSRLNVTLPSIFHAAWLYTLFQEYQINPTVGLVLSGRLIAIDGVEDVVGPMFNTIPAFINQLSIGADLLDLITACHKFNVGAVAYQHSSLRNIAKWLGRPPGEPLFDSLLVFIKNQVELSKGMENDLWTQTDSSGYPDYPLNLEIEQMQNEADFNITLLVQESKKLSQETAHRLEAALCRTLLSLDRGEKLQLPQEFVQSSIRDTIQPGPVVSSILADGDNQPDQWTEASLTLRREIATLISAKEESIGQTKPSIFELGLDSIDVLKLAARLKKAGLLISTSKMMQNPTIAGMMAHIQQPKKASTNHACKPDSSQSSYLQPLVSTQTNVSSDDDAILPVTFMQEGLLLNFKQYYHVLPYLVRRNTDIERLLACSDEVLANIATMRIYFSVLEETDSEQNFLQVVDDSASMRTTQIAVSDTINLDEMIRDFTREAINSASPEDHPRVVIAEAQEEHVMLICLSHALYDGWSMRLLTNAIESRYNGQELPQQTAAMIRAHLDVVNAQHEDSQAINFWQETLKDSQPTLFGLSAATNSLRVARVINRTSTVPIDAVRSTLRLSGVTMQTLGLACWKMILANNTKNLDVVHGVVLSGRTTEGSDELIFPTFNTILSRATLDLTITKTDWLRRVQADAVGVLDYQHFPLKKALALAQNPGSMLFNSLFTFQKAPARINKEAPLLKEYSIDDDTLEPPYAVNVEMSEMEDTILWTLGVQSDVATMEEMEDLLGQLDTVMVSLISDTDRSIAVSTQDGVSICGLNFVYMKSPVFSKKENKEQSTSMVREDVWTDLELRIRAVLARVAKVDASQISKSTSIFHLGLDSVSAIKVAGQLRKCDINLPVSELVQAHDIKQMARLATTSHSAVSSLLPDVSNALPSLSNEALSLLSVDSADIEYVLPATSGQTLMLDMWRASEKHLAYATFWYEISNASKPKMDMAVSILTERVPMLRTTFVEDSKGVFALTLKRESANKYPLPWKARFVENQPHILMELSIHHALYDAVSLNLIEAVLTQLCYDIEFSCDFATDLRPFVNLVQNYSDQAQTVRQNFWTEYLRHGQPGNEDGQLSGSFTSDRHEIFVPDLLRVEQFEPKLRQCGISVQSLVFAAYAYVHGGLRTRNTLSNSCENKPETVTLGVYLGNRSHDLGGSSELIAPTINIVPLSISVSQQGGLRILQTAKQIQMDVNKISRAEHCGVSMRDIHKWTSLKLDGYMNFLKLPKSEDESYQRIDATNSLATSTSARAGDITIRHAGDEVLAKARELFSSHRMQSISDTADMSQTPASPFLLDEKGLTQVNQKDLVGQPDVSTSRPWSYFIPAIDFEAKITNEGTLAIGVFAPKDMVSSDDIQYIVENVKKHIMSIVD